DFACDVRANEEGPMATVGLILIVVALVGAVLIYNGLVSLRNQVQNGWKQIDVQLKRRHDLIPNLVETVKGVMQYERDTLESVMEARARAVAASGVRDSATAENALSQSLGRLLAVMENYPALKADENALKLQEELTTTENQLAFARQFYNDTVMQFNTRQEVFPASVIANFFAFKPAEYFTAADEERGTPRVDLSLQK
ncbi:MAG TPA: LemA family protein, partial [Candidatus Acidoferrales bacterium]|nr:LemA family protein [Candidatus Acidoferrales bacterium]